MSQYCHLHCHTQYSLLDGAANIEKLINKTKQLGMTSLAITDHGNMFGIPKFTFTAQQAGIKPIIGCEFYLTHDMHDKTNKTRYHQLLLAKNETGYKNLIKLSSLSYTQGFYYKPRIDKELIKKHKEGLIATTSCLAGEIPTTIIKQGEQQAEKLLLEWHEIFGEDYYIELQRHGIEQQNTCNQTLMKWAKKHNIKPIATNDTHYIEQQDNEAQDILLCLQTGKQHNDPSRMRFANNQFFLKSTQQMQNLFQDIPQAITNTIEIQDKVTPLSLEKDVLMPIYTPPTQFQTQEQYLKHLTTQNAKKIYKQNLTQEIQQRIDYELNTINSMGFAGYFLIVQDFVNAAKKLGVIVGPGRGSVVGSLAAYCLGITNVDPLKYNLIFERFLNPERISMPDIDLDFDDEGRKKVINYVAEKYGRKQVAQLITFGSMAARSSIKDVARVLGISIEKSNQLAKLVPEKPGTTLAKAFQNIPELKKIKDNINTPENKVLQLAETLEGSARHTGIHAAGIIIAPDTLTNHIPIKSDKESPLLITQYDGTFIEQLGMLKMDFLGLKTLTIIKDTIQTIKQQHNTQINIDNIPTNDQQTFQIFQKGQTIAVFQFESEGMQQCLKDLKPTTIEDLIAMNSLYRPGPMQFIPNFIKRKHGKEKIKSPHPLLDKILQNTYGIIVYQEQVMKAAQIIAGYTLAEADILRRAMGKKKPEEMAKQKERFIQGAIKTKNINKQKAQEIFELIAKFAQYGFPRAHATAYAIIAYQTAYLKAHYTAEYMCSVLKHNQQDIAKISFFMKECQNQNIQILSPDINESHKDFSVNKQKQIRFGLTAIKGTGHAAVETIINERQKKGPFKDIYNFVERSASRKVTKKTIESLAMAGAFDKISQYHRKQYTHTTEHQNTFIEQLTQYAQQINKTKNNIQQSLFADTENNYITKPKPKQCTPYTTIEQLIIEKELVGFYISGHPLQEFELEIKHFCNANSTNILTFKNKQINTAGIITTVQIKQTKTNQKFAIVTIEDHEGTITTTLFGETFLKFQHLLHKGTFIHIKAKITQRYNKSDTWEIRPINIQPLQQIRNKLTKTITINIPAHTINPNTINTLQNIITQNQGQTQLKINITDTQQQITTNTYSKKYKIEPNNTFIQQITKLQNTTYSINT